MEVKAGYKQTEVGVIPQDWNATPLPDVIWFQEGPGLRKWQFRSSGLKVINVTNLQENGYLDTSNTERYISWDEFERMYKHFLVDEGDVVVASSGNSYCKTAIVRAHDLPLVMNTSVIRFKPKGGTTRAFMLIYLKSKYFKDQIDLMITGGAQPNFGPFHLQKVLIPLPPTKAEQEAIAEALSDADALIEALEQLIAKKRQIKQGAMQELLIGKKRLPGFTSEWEVKRLGEIAEIVSGGTPSTRIAEYWNGDIDWCTPTDITGTEGKYLTHTEKRITEAGLKNSSANLLPKGALLLCSRATIGDVKIATDKICTNQGFKSLICSDQVYNEFLYYVILTLKPKLLEKGIGSTFLEISKKDTASIEIKLPPVPEQTAIAEILSDMDAEIAALEGKLSKARQIKQGMMQELLTGRIRLV